ncbi:MAG: hypothetical protein NVS9B1_15630 [Candidatus Dormibacteraceae bacterium]
MQSGTVSRPGRRSWSALKSAYHAYSGLFWIVPRTPSLQLGIAGVLVVAGLGLLLRLAPTEIALIVMVGTVLLAVEALNTSVEMLCDHLHPQRHPAIGKVKDVAAGATAITEVGGVVVLVLVLGPHLWRLVAG